MKGRVLYADDTKVKVELMINCKKVEVPRKSVMEVRDPTKPL